MRNKINITTLGCPKNQVDSGHLTKRFLAEGFIQTDDAHKADILLVNTCGFIKDAKEESIEEILSIAGLKDSGKQILVFGCLGERYKGELVKEIPEIDGVWGVGEEDQIIEHCKKLNNMEATGKDNVLSKTLKPSLHSESYAYLKIAEGCDKKCTFCVIPSIRGKFRSQPPEDILKEAEGYINGGIRELILVAQDITRYGKEFRGYNLASLLKDIVSIHGDFRVRLLYLYPTEIDEELLNIIASEEKIFKYLDIPLQHSEDKILRLMGRRGNRKEYIRLIRNIKRKIPGIAIRTTFIVGFPTETEADFNGLVDFIEEMRFERLGVF
ncbi:MAG: 30S ribosomal protein S12 methylthiotransferase RimO, partial [Nitrospirae bacterium]|nr:30S ribosomal protein S12 methylthiotransferase RimO [Nitrospirota bacterium]